MCWTPMQRWLYRFRFQYLPEPLHEFTHIGKLDLCRCLPDGPRLAGVIRLAPADLNFYESVVPLWREKPAVTAIEPGERFDEFISFLRREKRRCDFANPLL